MGARLTTEASRCLQSLSTPTEPRAVNPDLVLLSQLNDSRMSHYQVLGVGRARLADDPMALTLARRALASKVHPDRFAESGPSLQQAAHDAMARCNQAYEVLSDVKLRKRYDMTTIAKHYLQCAACKGEGSLKKQRGFVKTRLIVCEGCGGAGHFARDSDA